MDAESAVPRPSTAAVPDSPGHLWLTSAAVAAWGAWLLFDALPGINWVLWTTAAVAGLHAFARRRGNPPPSLAMLSVAAVAVAGAAAVTASMELVPLIAIAIVFLLAVAMLVTAGVPFGSITARFAVTAPVMALWNALSQTMRRSIEATQHIRSTRAQAWVRGLAITVPVLVVFALLLAAADPIFAAGRDALEEFIARLEFIPRIVFFFALLVIVLGAYGYAAATPAGPPLTGGTAPVRWLGATERLILLAGIAALFWVFLAVQVGYLFGNLPQLPTSGITFAEYARRGFGELSVVASASALLIVVSERYGHDDGRERMLRLLTLAVIAAVLLLLASAFRRVWLYEEAYGFTTARLFAQVYMCGVAVAMVLLALEVAGDFDSERLFRRAAVTAALLFLGLVYWNHEGWIARQNIARFATTGKLDVAYLTKGLSSGALPAIAEGLPSLPELTRSELVRAVQERWKGRSENRPRRWFEWNLAASRARWVMRERFGET